MSRGCVRIEVMRFDWTFSVFAHHHQSTGLAHTPRCPFTFSLFSSISLSYSFLHSSMTHDVHDDCSMIFSLASVLCH